MSPRSSAQRVEVGREQAQEVEAAARDALPVAVLQEARVDLALPQHLERVALGVVFEAGQAHQRAVAWCGRGGDVFDQVLARADVDDVARLGAGSNMDGSSGDRARM